jgi:hypothetical protein
MQSTRSNSATYRRRTIPASTNSKL